MDIPKERLNLFDTLIKSLFIAIKNNIFYTQDHPICTVSIESFKSLIEKWFEDNEKIEIGISQDQIWLDGVCINKNAENYKEIANYLHNRGILSLTIFKDVSIEEITDFLNAIRFDVKSIREKGGVLKNISPAKHLIMKEIDYSTLLSEQNEAVETGEEKIWQSLFHPVDELSLDELPESKIELLADFFKDTMKSALLLNKLYRQAVSKVTDETMVRQMRNAIIKVCKYYDQNSETEKASEFKSNLMSMVSQLHPDLIARLFESTLIEGESLNLAEEITKDFSDSYIAGFIESLITAEGSINENLLRLFDKLTPDSTRMESIVSVVADKLFNKGAIRTNTLTELQTSIKEIFREHPQNDFLEEMYKITIDAVINRKIDTLTYMPKLSPLINKFVQSLQEENFTTETTWLYLNILSLEDSPSEFKKFSEKLLTRIDDYLDNAKIESVREIYEFFIDKIHPEQRHDNRIAKLIKESVSFMTTHQMIKHIISLIPETKNDDLKHISYILYKTKDQSTNLLLDTILRIKSSSQREKYGIVVSSMKTSISNEVTRRLEYCEPHLVRHLLKVLKDFIPENAHQITQKMLTNKNPQILWEALDGFTPQNEDEILQIFTLFHKAKDTAIQRKAASALLKTNDKKIINRIFKHALRGNNRQKILANIIDLSGMMNVQEANSHIKKIFTKRTIVSTKQIDIIRIKAARCLMKLKQSDALQVVQTGLHDKSRIVREECMRLIEWSNENEESLFNPEVFNDSFDDDSE